MTRLASFTLAAALAAGLALTALAPDSRADAPALGGDEPTHSLSIDYQDGHDVRRARLTLAPLSDDVDALWRGPLHSISVLTTKGQWIIIESFASSSHRSGHHAEAQAMLPGPQEIAVIIFRPERGASLAWKVEEGESYTEVEWTYRNAAGRDIPAPTPRGAEEACSTTGCEIVDPWTCECQSSTRDPYSKEIGRNSLRIVAQSGDGSI